MSGTPWRLLTIDIDGTLTTVHGWRVLAERRGRRAEYERSNRRFFSHEIGEDEHLHDLLEMAVGMPLGEVADVLESTPKLTGIGEAVEGLHARGMRVALLTHNPSYVCAWYRDRFGFDEFEGTRGADVEDGHVGEVGQVHADKPAGLERLTRRLGVRPSETVHVGDGWADAALFPSVGAGVALNSRLPEVRAAADRALDTTDLRALLLELDGLRPRPR